MAKTNCKLVFAANSSIVVEKMDQAFFDRMIVVPFMHLIERADQQLQRIKNFSQ